MVSDFGERGTVRIHPDDVRYCSLGVERGNPQPHEAHEYHYRYDGPDGLVVGVYYCGGATEGDRVWAAVRRLRADVEAAEFGRFEAQDV